MGKARAAGPAPVEPLTAPGAATAGPPVLPGVPVPRGYQAATAGEVQLAAQLDLGSKRGCFDALTAAARLSVAGELDHKRAGTLGYLVARALDGHNSVVRRGLAGRRRPASLQDQLEQTPEPPPAKPADPPPYEQRLRQARRDAVA